MKPQLKVWIALIFLLLLGLAANMVFTQLYRSDTRDLRDRCTASAVETRQDPSYCIEAKSAADAAQSASASVSTLILLIAFMSTIVVAARVFSNEKRIDDLEKRLK